MNKINKRSIVFKIFVVTCILLLLSAFFIYGMVYFILPKYYYSHLKNNIENQTDKLINKVKDKEISDSTKYLNEFSVKNNALVYVSDERNDTKILPIVPQDSNFILSYHQSYGVLGQDPWPYYVEPILEYHVSIASGSLNVLKKKINFKNDSKTYYISVYTYYKSESQAASVFINSGLPYVWISILFIAVLGAAIYAKIISKPLLKMNSVAREMANMNFDVKCEVNGKDEIGQLSSSLNELSRNLEASMNELKEKNKKLKNDIDREHEFEIKRREFIAAVSHELKTPITIIKGQLEGMIYNIGMYKDRDKYLRHSMQVVDNMQELVHELIDISKLESTSFSLKKEEMNLSLVIDSCIENYKYLAENKNINIILCIDKDVVIKAEPRLMSKVISNIINNAITHSKNGEVVTINFWKKDTTAIFEVQNSEAHIDENEIERIFEAFYRVDKSRSRSSGGSGLGLYIVKMILDMHDLKYKIENTSSGVKFTVVFLI